MRIEFKGADKLARKLREVATKYPRERDLFLKQEAENLLSRVKPLTPSDTGRLRGAWSRTEPAGGNIDVYDNTEYAPFVEFGHRIVAWGHDTGRVQPGAFMLRDAVDDLADNFQADATRILARLFN